MYNNAITNYPNGRHGLPPKKVDDLEKEEIYVTLIGILKKQDERIKELEKKLG
mgnify:CR=1 FL=1